MIELRLSVLRALHGATRKTPGLHVLAFAALACAGLFEITGPGLWDPVELGLAELARQHQTPPPEQRVATWVVSAAFRVFGVSAWAGRAPILLLSLVGAYAAFSFARRFGVKRAGTFVLIVLATAPAYALPSRLINAPIVPLTASLVTFASLATAVFASDLRALRRASLVTSALVAGLVSTWSRGLLVGIAVPALAVGMAAVIHPTPAWRRARVLAAYVLLAMTSVLCAVAFVPATPRGLVVFVLGPEHVAQKAASFEAAWTLLGTSLFPWSAVLPLALAQLLRRAPRGIEPGPRTALVAWLVLSLFAHGALATRDTTAPFVGLGGLSMAIGMSLAELDARDVWLWSGRVMSMLVLTIVAYLACDEVTRAPAKVLLAITTQTVAPLSAGMEGDVARSFRLAAVLVSAFAMAPILVTAIADLPPGAFRTLLPAPLVHRLRAAASRIGTFVLAGGMLGGLALRVGLYPRMLRAFAPDAAFERFAAKVRPGERLGLFGVNPRTLIYMRHAPLSTPTLANATEAVSWLAPRATGAADAKRDFVALKQKDFANVNALYRRQHGTNVFVLGSDERVSDVAGDAVLLATSTLLPGERNANPISGFIFDRAPSMQRQLDADFSGKLEALGWGLESDNGETLDHVPPRALFHIKVSLRVHDPPGAGYCTFVHLEHTPTRATVEHKDFKAYPMGLWQRGDVVLDDFVFKLSPHFNAGRYTLYYGIGVLPCDDDRRLALTRGPGDESSRLRAGEVEVR